MITCRPGVEGDQLEIKNLRDKIGYGLCPRIALNAVWNECDERYAFMVDGKILALFGITRGGLAWLSVSEGIEKYKLTMVKLAKKYVKKWRNMFEHIYTTSPIWGHWLRTIGFEEAGYYMDSIPLYEVKYGC